MGKTLITKISITNTRFYFFKRLITNLMIKIKPLQSIIGNLFFNKNKKLDISDVEQIFLITNTERESENIFVINQLIEIFKLNDYIDIGCNYGQFCNGFQKNFNHIQIIDANKDALNYAEKLITHSNIKSFHAAVVPSSVKSDFVLFDFPQGNTGLGKVDLNDNSGNGFRVRTIKIKDLIANSTSEQRLIKIDVEGLEPELCHDIINLNNQENTIIAFEVLDKESQNKLDSVFSTFNYKFLVARYDFLHSSGLMGANKYGLLKAFFLGSSKIEIFRSSSITDFGYDFIPLVFAIPEKHINLIDDHNWPSSTAL